MIRLGERLKNELFTLVLYIPREPNSREIRAFWVLSANIVDAKRWLLNKIILILLPANNLFIVLQ